VNEQHVVIVGAFGEDGVLSCRRCSMASGAVQSGS
jgi:hypothetical protein